jgi:hypothetical protein
MTTLDALAEVTRCARCRSGPGRECEPPLPAGRRYHRERYEAAQAPK